jgi:hypothetical protein
MFQSLCGIAVACTVTGQPAKVVEASTAIQSPPRIVEVEQRVVTEPRQRGVVRNPPVYPDQDNRCEQYNCVGPRTDFRLPDEVPYPYYEQQYTRLPPGG